MHHPRQMLWSIGEMHVTSTAPLQALEPALRIACTYLCQQALTMAAAAPNHIASSIASLARIRYRPDVETCTALIEAVQPHMHACTAQDLGDLVWGVAVLHKLGRFQRLHVAPGLKLNHAWVVVSVHQHTALQGSGTCLSALLTSAAHFLPTLLSTHVFRRRPSTQPGVAAGSGNGMHAHAAFVAALCAVSPDLGVCSPVPQAWICMATADEDTGMLVVAWFSAGV